MATWGLTQRGGDQSFEGLAPYFAAVHQGHVVMV
jgi:hypothetical protein